MTHNNQKFENDLWGFGITILGEENMGNGSYAVESFSDLKNFFCSKTGNFYIFG